MPYALLVPLLPLLTAIILLIGKRETRDRRAQIGVLPIMTAFFGAIGALRGRSGLLRS